MSRHFIIGILVLLILGVIGGTVVLVINNMRDGETDPAEDTPGSGVLDPSEPGSPIIGDPETPGRPVDPSEEREPIPLDEAPRAPIAVDQYFSTNLDLTGGTRNLTQDYQRQFKEEDRTPDTLAEFARSQPIITQLPRPVERTIDLQASDTPLLMSEYMAIAGNLKFFSERTLLAIAIDDLYSKENPETIKGMASKVRIHQRNLIRQHVPPSAANLHRLLLGYTELLASTYDQMARYPEDPVRGVTAMHQLEQIDKKFFPLIEQEVDRLNALSRQLSSR